MKKIFYILASAIVALGAVACENDGLDNIATVNGDTVSFIASIDNNRTALDGLDTVWDTDDTIQIEWNETTYNFKNSAEEPNKFSCTEEGLSGIVNANITATYSHNNDGNIDSNAGTAGALLTYTGPFAGIEFAVQNAFLKFTATADAEVKLTASAEIFSTGNTLTLTATGAEQYVAVLPKTTTITYAINGTNYGVSQNNTLVAGKIYPLGDLEVPGWKLVTDASELAVGDQIVIAATGSNHALGADKGNNRNAATITKSSDKSTITINNDVQIITLENGKVSGTFAFNVGTGYLYAASSGSNYLKTKTDLDSNGSWKIEITSAGVATIKAQGDNTRNWIRKNSSSDLFACYGSGQNDVCIYKYVSGKGTPIVTKLEMSEINCTAQTENTLTFTWTAVANATGYEVTINDKTETVTELTYTAKGLQAGTEYTIEVVAKGDGINYTDSDAKDCKGTTAEEQQQPEGGVTADPETITFANLGLSDTSNLTTIDAKNATLNFAKGTNTNNNVPKYYANGTNARVYTGNTMVVSSDYNIIKIEITFSGTSYAQLSATPGSYNLSGTTGTWTGSATAVTFTATANSRITSIKITYEATGEGGTTEPETPEVKPIEITVANANIANTEGEDTIPVTVTNGEGYEFEVTTTADWIEVEWNNGVYYIAEANDTTEARTATVSINATDGTNEKTVNFTITQAAGEEVVEPEQPTEEIKTYTWTLKSGDLKTSAGTISKGTPAFSWSQTTATYIGWDATKGVQVGSKNSATTSFTLSTSAISGTIKKITVNASIASSGTAKMSINVGGTNYLTNQALSTSAKEYTATINKSGDIKISFSNTARAFYIKSIVIEYAE